ncbi:Phosphogluconate dehydratase [compost metagenome]
MQDGDIVRLDAVSGTLDVLVDAAEWQARTPAAMPADLAEDNGLGFGRELFAGFRRNALSAEEGACSWL